MSSTCATTKSITRRQRTRSCQPWTWLATTERRAWNSNYRPTCYSNLVNLNQPDRGAYLSLTVPLRNRGAQANQIRSELEYRQNQLNLQQQKNQINLQVRNAAFALQQAGAGVESARAARDYALQSLDAEQKKYALGASTSYLVLQQQSNSTQAASNYVAALSTYEKARVALDQVTARILDRMAFRWRTQPAGMWRTAVDSGVAAEFDAFDGDRPAGLQNKLLTFSREVRLSGIATS